MNPLPKPRPLNLMATQKGGPLCAPGTLREGPIVGLALATLVMLRWIAVAGQGATLMAAHYAFDFEIAFLPALLAVCALAGSNLALMASERRRLTESRAAAVLAFDLVQLATLLGLTGGLQNPFSMLLLAPVTVSATILSRRSTAALAILALTMASIISFLHLPLPWVPQEVVFLPAVYQLGLWTALTMSVVFIATYVWTASEDSRRMSDALSESADALAREREMSSLGALAAAAAHELGSPLSTIALVSKELKSAVDKDSPLYEDIELLQSQSDRCREILVGLSQKPGASGDPFETLPLYNLVELSTQGHIPEDVTLDIEIDENCEGPEPKIRRTPEFLNGIGNFVSNAGQFAKSVVQITLYWTQDEVWITVRDDGPGFSGTVLQTLGEPYLSTRAGQDGHMGLGVFIATTLLERIGGETTFRNRKGAEIFVYWRREDLEAEADAL